MLRLSLAVVLVAAGTAARAEGRWQPLANDATCAAWNADPQEDEEVVWTGGCINRRASGNGTLIWRFAEDGEAREFTCAGAMRNGRLHGRARCRWPDGGRYDGGWSDGKQHGQGVEDYADGGHYEGDYWMGKLHGEGTFTYADGGRYVGAWRAGTMHGEGVRHYGNGARYEGGWEGGRYHGRGAITFASGDRCEADWQAGEMVGTGVGLSGGKATTCTFDPKENRVSFGD